MIRALLLGLFVGGLVATVVVVHSLYRREPVESCWRDWAPGVDYV